MKLIVSIKSSPKHQGRQEAIKDTWGKAFIEHGAEVFFTISDQQCDKPYFVSAKEGELPIGTLHVPGVDQHIDLTNRMIWLMSYLKKREFDHVVTIDDDVSVNVPLFMTLPWRGTELYGNDNGGYFAGCCTVWSKKATDAYYPEQAFDDVSYADRLKRKGIEFTPARPVKGAYSNPIRPWLWDAAATRPDYPAIPKNERHILQEGVAVQHYNRSPDEIRENHRRLTEGK